MGKCACNRKTASLCRHFFTAGGSTGGLEGGGTIGYVGGLIKALVTGLLAGENLL
jgi:fumarate reductase flavoprotein subunit